MVTFKSRQEIIRSASTIERRAHSVYPHISPTRAVCQANSLLGIKKWEDINCKYLHEVNGNLSILRMFIDNVRHTASDMAITCLKNNKVGNCGEEAILARIIGKLSGQRNIYTGNLIAISQKEKSAKPTGHAVAFITDSPVFDNCPKTFSQKEAVIIDPWLGITDVAGNYFNKLKNAFKNNFAMLDSDKAKDINFRVIPFDTTRLKGEKLLEYRDTNPELVIKNYKRAEIK